MGRIILSPFNRTLQSELLKRVGGEESLDSYLLVLNGFHNAYHNCSNMLLKSDIGNAIEHPLLLLKRYSMQNSVNTLNFKTVVACLNCFEYGPKGEFDKSHKCSVVDPPARYELLTHPTFEAYENALKEKLTEPQQALLLFCPPRLKKSSKPEEINYYGTNVLAYGPPGVGKTFVLPLIVIAHMKRFGWDSILVVCMVGRLASELPLGKTINSGLGLGELTEEITMNFIAPKQHTFVPYSEQHFNLVTDYLKSRTRQDTRQYDKLTFVRYGKVTRFPNLYIFFCLVY